MWAAATKAVKFFTGPTVDEQADNAISSVDNVAMRQQEEIIDLKDEISQLEANVRRLHGAGNKAAATKAFKLMQQKQRRLAVLEAKNANSLGIKDNIKDAKDNRDMLEAMKQTNAAQGRLAGVIDPEIADSVMQEAQDHSMAHQEISDTLARDIHGTLVDEDELADDLESFMSQGSTTATTTTTTSTPVYQQTNDPLAQRRRAAEDKARAEEEAMAELLARAAKPPATATKVPMK